MLSRVTPRVPLQMERSYVATLVGLTLAAILSTQRFGATGSLLWQILASLTALSAMVYLHMLLHEFGHVLGCQLRGIRVTQVTVRALSGFVAIDHATVRGDRDRQVVLVAGPLANALWTLLAVIILALRLAPTLAIVLNAFAVAGLISVVINLLPYPSRTDGAKIYRYWWTARRSSR